MDLKNRISGFANANKKKFDSANSAYKHYMNAAGDEEDPEAKPDFKTFLDAAKSSGVLDTLLKDGVSKLKKEAKIEDEPVPEKKKFTLSTGAIIGIVLGVAAIGTVIYFVRKKNKQA